MGPGDLDVWLNHFEHHARRSRRMPEGLDDVLTPGESRLVAASLATLGHGEQARGRALLRAAERFASTQQMPQLVRIVELLCGEERRHAALIAAFMHDHRLPSKRADGTVRVFRRAHRLGDFEPQLSVLLCAELIKIVCYRSLESATNCRRLQVLCRTLAADELAYVAFESELLLALRARRGTAARALRRPLHRLFFAGAAACVWLTHRKVLNRAGHGARSFVRACLAQYAFTLEPCAAARAVTVRTARVATRSRSSSGTV